MNVSVMWLGLMVRNIVRIGLNLFHFRDICRMYTVQCTIQCSCYCIVRKATNKIFFNLELFCTLLGNLTDDAYANMHSSMQGCGSAFIFCRSGSSSFLQCGSGSCCCFCKVFFEKKFHYREISVVEKTLKIDQK